MKGNGRNKQEQVGEEKLNVNASPEKAWKVVGDLANVDKWIPGITDVRVEGKSKRICTFSNGHVQHEEIHEYSDKKRSYRYTIEGVPGITNNSGSFSVKPSGKGSVIVWSAEFDVLDRAQEAQIIRLWKEATKTVLESLRTLIEL